VNGLAYENQTGPKSARQRKGIQTTARNLLQLPIVDEFRAQYAEWFIPADFAKRSEPLGKGFTKGLSKGFTKGLGKPSGSGSGSGSSSKTPRSVRHEPDGFAEAWAAYPTREGSNPRKAAATAYTARLREGVTAADLLAGVQRYRAFCDAKGQTGTQYVMHAATFFGADGRYAEPWTVTSPATGAGDHAMGPEEYTAYLAAEKADTLRRQAERDAEYAAHGEVTL